MSSSSGENFQAESSVERYAELSAEAAKIGMCLVSLDAPNETEPRTFTSRESLLVYAADNQVSEPIALRAWTRMQELYAAKLRYLKTGVKTESTYCRHFVTPVTTPLVFRHALPLPDASLEDADSWTEWSQTLSELNVPSLGYFVIQLESAKASNTKLNPYRTLLGKGSSGGMAKLVTDFYRHINS